MQLMIRSMIQMNQPIYPAITKKNIIKYVGSEKNGVSEQRLFQIFTGHVHKNDLKRRDRYVPRLLRLLKVLNRRGIIYLDEKNWRLAK